MPLNIETIEQLKIPQVASNYGADDAIYYALSVGIGMERMERRDLKYVYEKDLEIIPTFFTTIGYPGPIFRKHDLGIDGTKVVHLEQSIHVPANMPTSATYTARNAISAIWDQGKGKAAFVEVTRTIELCNSETAPIKMKQLIYCPGGGGFGGVKAPSPKPLVPTEFHSEKTFEFLIPYNAAFLYRMNGDRNPLHIDVEYARARGFQQPILHGLYLYGLVAQYFVRYEGYDRTTQDFSMHARFLAPAFAGEEYRLSFCQVSDRSSVIFGNLLKRNDRTEVTRFSIMSPT